MNNTRRNQIRELISKLETINFELDVLRGEIESTKEEEQEYYDNIPENLQNSERAENSEYAIDDLDSAISNIENALEYTNDALNNLESSIEN